jgi:hypothetical protein
VIQPKLLSSALIVVVMLAAPAVAHDGRAISRHLAEKANANTTPGAYRFGEDSRFRDQQSRDVWGHWGTYYGPMVPTVP